MSEIRYYTVTETRELKVSASDPTTAINLATEVFAKHEVVTGEGVNVLKPIRIRSIEAREDY